MNYTDAIDILFEETPMEIIYEYDETPDFFQFRGEAGGDVMCYRIYKETGQVTAR